MSGWSFYSGVERRPSYRVGWVCGGCRECPPSLPGGGEECRCIDGGRGQSRRPSSDRRSWHRVNTAWVESATSHLICSPHTTLPLCHLLQALLPPLDAPHIASTWWCSDCPFSSSCPPCLDSSSAPRPDPLRTGQCDGVAGRVGRAREQERPPVIHCDPL